MNGKPASPAIPVEHDRQPPTKRRRQPQRRRGDKPKVEQAASASHVERSDAKVSFGCLTVSQPVGRALEWLKYQTPTPIQEEVIPLALAGRDIVGQAQTGTGKTAAFAIPLIESVDLGSREVQALVLVPTRELAVQVNGEITRLGQYAGVKSTAVYGGQAISRQLTSLERGAHVIVATPGRLMDHMERRTVRLDRIRIAVLDEADQMLDIGFAPDIERILRRTPRSRQTMLFSATMPGPIKVLAHRYLKDPAWTRVGGEAEPVEQVDQVYYEVAEQDRLPALSSLLEAPDQIAQALIFRRTKIGVDRLVRSLQKRRVDAQGIHGDMTQGQRTDVMARFRAKKLRVLVATNVAARGLDIPAVSHVINYDMPDNLEEYVHRIGRTARMGRHGTAITFVSEWDFPTLEIIQNHVGESLRRERLAFLYG